MIKVIPAILAKDKKEFDDKINKVKGLVDWVHLDVMDGKFVKNKTYWDLDIPFKKEVHLMIENPKIEDWQEADRIIVHRETVGALHATPLRIGIAYNPQTSIDIITDFILIMCVEPGYAGQKFQEKVLAKIRKLRKENPEIDIEVDGGINLKTGRLAVQAGANILAVGNYLLKSKNIKETINELQNCG